MSQYRLKPELTRKIGFFFRWAIHWVVYLRGEVIFGHFVVLLLSKFHRRCYQTRSNHARCRPAPAHLTIEYEIACF